jgi:hypothetical protein
MQFKRILKDHINFSNTLNAVIFVQILSTNAFFRQQEKMALLMFTKCLRNQLGRAENIFVFYIH